MSLWRTCLSLSSRRNLRELKAVKKSVQWAERAALLEIENVEGKKSLKVQALHARALRKSSKYACRAERISTKIISLSDRT